MAEQISIPAGYGGLLRYNEEYTSRFNLKPIHVILFTIMIIVFVIILNVFWPISS